MQVNPEHLLTFLVVAEHGSLTAAGEQLHLSQPAISSQLKQLTTVVGEPLFQRHRHGVTLTNTGQGLLEHARTVQRALQGTRTYLQDLQGLQTGNLRVAASLTIAATLLPGMLAHYHQQHPGVKLQVRQGNTREVLNFLLNSTSELALIEGPPPLLPTDVHSFVFHQDHLVLVASPQHPLAHEQVQTSDLQHLPVIWREAGSGTREVAERALQQAGLQVQTVLELAGTEAVKEAVLQNLGVAFLSERSVQREVQTGLLVQLPVPLQGLQREFRVVGGPPATQSRAVQAFLTLLQDTPS
ncbi:LysR substrate-binding domain-containing protein [Deinococcus roseus]|uniref:Transcriptional regulator n=1 Tax=Deinococcus roseus TaxID=392414 RepID=A0ABQ2D8K4_9DEIO|nr:LysR substrate-binding domain-containing protein [Deinococcus roseus]GGJ47526.1 transcriptional regulator [Deinococcus roseus]